MNGPWKYDSLLPASDSEPTSGDWLEFKAVILDEACANSSELQDKLDHHVVSQAGPISTRVRDDSSQPPPFVPSVVLSRPADGTSFKLSTLPIQDNTAAITVEGRAQHLSASQVVWLLVKPVSPPGGGFFVQDDPAVLDAEGVFTCTCWYGIDRSWGKGEWSFQILAVVLDASEDPTAYKEPVKTLAFFHTLVAQSRPLNLKIVR